MSRLVIICTACLTFIVYTKGRQLNIDDIKELIKLADDKKHTSTSSEDSSEEDYNNRKMLRTMDVLDLIQKNNINERYRLLNQNELLKKYGDVQLKEKLTPSKQYPLPFVENQRNLLPSNVLKHIKRSDPDIDLNALIKQQLIEHLMKNSDINKKKKYLSPYRLLSPVTLKGDDERGEKDELNEYSKIFVILDASALQKNGNKNDEESLLSKILSLSSAMDKKSRQGKNKLHFYKGFRVKDDLSSRRYRRESKEGYGGISKEDEGMKKRPSGGGGGAGRTGIPYVKIRGDIYERDH